MLDFMPVPTYKTLNLACNRHDAIFFCVCTTTDMSVVRPLTFGEGGGFSTEDEHRIVFNF